MEKMEVRFSQIRVTVCFEESGSLPFHKESAIRGGMGQCLLQQNCIQDRNCGKCSFRPECIVQKIMYSKYQITPDYVTKESLGYTLFCPDERTEAEAGMCVTFTMTLFGYTILYFSQIINAIHALGLSGLGKDRVRFRIQRVTNRRGEPILTGQRIYMGNYTTEILEDYLTERMADLKAAPCRFRLLSPFCSKYRGEYIHDLNAETAQGFINAAARRAHMLMLYEGIPAEPFYFGAEDYRFLGGRARTELVSRYSTTADQKVDLRGIRGYLDIEIRNPDLLKCALAGELAQIGKNTRFGFGVYRIERLAPRG